MPYVDVKIHYVWCTKNRMPFLENMEMRNKVWQHMRDNAKEKGIYIDFINGHKEHCHCLVSLGTHQTIDKVAQLLKGESSYWINKQAAFNEHLKSKKFGWQDEYFAVSVSKSMVEKVRNYIKNQEEHHKSKSFQEEYDELINKYGFRRFGG